MLRDASADTAITQVEVGHSFQPPLNSDLGDVHNNTQCKSALVQRLFIKEACVSSEGCPSTYMFISLINNGSLMVQVS